MIVFLEKSLVILAIFLCGGIVFSENYSTLFIPLYLVLSIFYSFSKKSLCHKSNACVLFVIVTWLLINNIFIQEKINTNQYIVIILYATSCYFFFSSISFYRFRELLLRYFKILCAVSILIQILSLLNIIPATKVISKGGTPKMMVMQLFVVSCGTLTDYDRLSSIYWEPGQFQIVIFFFMLLFADELGDISKLKYNFKRFYLLLISLLFTISTTGYICLTILVIFLLLKNNAKKRSLIKKIALVITSIIFLILIFNSSAIQKKMNEHDSGSDVSSLAIRLSDNMALLKISNDYFWTGTGVDSKLFTNLSYKYGSITASNGWLWTSATSGVPFLFFILLLMFRNIKSRSMSLSPWIVFIILLLAQCNEFFPFFPYLFMYILKFNNSSKSLYLKCK